MVMTPTPRNMPTRRAQTPVTRYGRPIDPQGEDPSPHHLSVTDSTVAKVGSHRGDSWVRDENGLSVTIGESHGR